MQEGVTFLLARVAKAQFHRQKFVGAFCCGSSVPTDSQRTDAHWGINRLVE